MITLRIGDFMTREPVWVEPDAPLAAVHALMWERRIRHVPVVRDGALVGMLSLRDMHLVESFDHTAFEQATVGEAMGEPLVVGPDTPLSDVLERMVTHRLGSAAVVGDGGALLGIFTRTDALAAFARILRQSESVAEAASL